MDHLDQYKDVCDDFGTNAVLSLHVIQKKVTGFTVKSFRSTKAGTLPSDWKVTFAYDPLWDNEEEWDMVEQEIQAELTEEGLVETVEKVSGDDEEVADVTKNWVRDFCVCVCVCVLSCLLVGGDVLAHTLHILHKCNNLEH